MRYLVISCSLNPDSRSRILAKIALDHLRARKLPAELIDLREMALPLCDASSCWDDANVKAIGARIEAARGIVLAAPIYNYDVNSTAKNLVELTGDAWNEKVVGFVCTAGGHGGFMSVMPFANSLMLDFRCVIIPRFVYSPRTAIDDTSFGDAAIHKRVEELTVELERVTEALFPTGG
jgi:NAD(P)H-dependent FMN reductase